MIPYDQKTLTPAQQEKVCRFVSSFDDAVRIVDEMFHDSLSDTDSVNDGDLKMRYALVSALKRLIVSIDPSQAEHM